MASLRRLYGLKPLPDIKVGDHVEVSYVDLVWGQTNYAGTVRAFGDLKEAQLPGGPRPQPDVRFAYIEPWPGAPENGVQEIALTYLRKLTLLEVLAWASV